MKIDKQVKQKNRALLNKPEYWDEIIRDFCKHLSGGHSASSWYWERVGIYLTEKDLQKRMDSHPEEFEDGRIEVALAKGRKLLEGKFLSIENNKLPGKVIESYMKNVYGWDSKKKEDEARSSSAVTLVIKEFG